MITKENWDTVELMIKRLNDDSVLMDVKVSSRMIKKGYTFARFSLGLCDIADAFPLFWKFLQEHQQKCERGDYDLLVAPEE